MVKKIKSASNRYSVLIGFLSLMIATLACGDGPWWNRIDPTALAPQDLSGMDLSYSPLYGMNFSGKDMRGVNLANSNITKAIFTNADLRDADLSQATAIDAIFNGADLRGAKLDRLCFRGSSWEDAQLDSRWREVVTNLDAKLMPNQDLQDLDLSGLCMHYYNLQNSNLSGADLSNTDLGAADFTGANLQGANLRDSWLAADFTKANLKGANVSEDDLNSFAILCETVMPDGQISNAGCSEK
jgi:uncharacterized protein YjbI with pentapeptide repeats